MSMPSTGLLSFLPCVRFRSTRNWCVNALNGLTFISTIWLLIIESISELGVNALNGLTFISTLHNRYGRVHECRVSMPSTGLLSFLQTILCQDIGVQQGVNALNGLTFISTRTQSTFSISVPSVNALNGLTFISTLHPVRGKPREAACQCPQRAYFHFYGSLSEPLILAASESYFCK